MKESVISRVEGTRRTARVVRWIERRLLDGSTAGESKVPIIVGFSKGVSTVGFYEAPKDG